MNLILEANDDTMLASIDAMGMTALHIPCSNPNVTIDVIKVLKDAYPHTAYVRNVVGMTPCMMLLQGEGLPYNEAFPSAC